MTDNELRERVARAFCAMNGEDVLCDPLCYGCLAEADTALAAIRPVIRAQALEEAARVCDELKPHESLAETARMHWCDGSEECAAAIRAMIGKEP